ncbi:BREX-2 system adenine-specific DNA-methyltransferase PglX [Pseudarthrobacter sp. O4]|uniref:BREX-2 system adenine-specific DNA-methyltransferase PglX n=1 Tax=Pseudarthrobacter sp. O4 TaxID=3418417 RepID=UPI003CF85F22
MTVSPQLTADLRKLVLRLEDDLRERLAQDHENLSRWKAEHQGALDAQRTSSAWQAWRDDKITQAAVAWIVTTVFVRFAEDNELVRTVWLSGPGVRRQEALDAQIAFFRAHPELTDREWLLEPVEYLKELPSTKELVGEHSALWQVQPSGRMATEILEFWRQTDDAGLPTFDLADTELSTRFLGDLYQDLSDYAKKTFALLQTPEFVEEFILDQTLTPALAERPLDGFKLIDPTCGSGHFLLGAFARLTHAWARHAPGLDGRARVQRALDAVHGVDLNPFAVAIARFRLTVAALKACNETSLELAPAFDFHLAAGDSLLHGQVQREFQFEGFDADSKLSGFSYASEDLKLLRQILKPDQYDVVVGNPPYITVKDKTLNEAYRKRYATCKGKYALTVPFMERFFGLAKSGGTSQPAGWTGQITSNSFMKRGFGSALIEDFLPRKDVTHVIDSEGAWIPGHNTDGTPTVIIIGRNQPPVKQTVRTVLSMGMRESRSTAQNGTGPYWTSTTNNLSAPGFENEWVTIVDLSRDTLARHPWSLSGGQAPAVLDQIESARIHRLSKIVNSIGIVSFTLEDDAYLAPGHVHRRASISADLLRPMVLGDGLRDFSFREELEAIFPYDEDFKALDVSATSHRSIFTFLWPYRTNLSNNVMFGRVTKVESGLKWTEFGRLTATKLRTPLSIVFAEIATHNHFVLDRGGKIFKHSAQVIKLPGHATEKDHFRLLGVLNSSVACFWMKEKAQPKGGAADLAWARTYDFTGTILQEFPLAANLSHDRGQTLDCLGRQILDNSPRALAEQSLPTSDRLAAARELSNSLGRRMIAEQEELDWETYFAYGFVDEDLTYTGSHLPEVSLGERAFEIWLGQKLTTTGAQKTWFDAHGSTPISEIPSAWPEDYKCLVRRRLGLIESNSSLQLLERPEFKRRWASESWEKQQDGALRDWLLDRLEDRPLWCDRQGRPGARSVGQLADLVSRDADFLSVLSLWDGSRDVDVVKALTQLLTDEAVPFLAAHRLKDSGLRKYEAWIQTWDMQRREDAGDDVGSIPVPPKYTSTDFRKASWWQARGKLDVPKERFILYPDAGRSTDQTLLLGWAGWNHVEQFLALAAIMDQLVADGAPDVQLIPLVAGMGEILPWVNQWHAEVDPAYGVSMADFCAQQFEERAAQIDRSHDQLKAWRPSMPLRGRKAKVTA